MDERYLYLGTFLTYQVIVCKGKKKYCSQKPYCHFYMTLRLQDSLVCFDLNQFDLSFLHLLLLIFKFNNDNKVVV